MADLRASRVKILVNRKECVLRLVRTKLRMLKTTPKSGVDEFLPLTDVRQGPRRDGVFSAYCARFPIYVSENFFLLPQRFTDTHLMCGVYAVIGVRGRTICCGRISAKDNEGNLCALLRRSLNRHRRPALYLKGVLSRSLRSGKERLFQKKFSKKKLF